MGKSINITESDAHGRHFACNIIKTLNVTEKHTAQINSIKTEYWMNFYKTYGTTQIKLQVLRKTKIL
jgi:hypothetical protein